MHHQGRQSRGCIRFPNASTVHFNRDCHICHFSILTCGLFLTHLVSEVSESTIRSIRSNHGVLAVSIGSTVLIEVNVDQ